MKAWIALDLATVHCEGLVDRHASGNGFLHPIIRTGNPGQYFQHLGNLVARNDHNPIGGVAEDQVTGVDHSAAIHFQGDLMRPRDAPGTSTNR